MRIMHICRDYHVIRWNYDIVGFVAITGEDENHEFRFLVFSDEAACSFPLEIKRKKLSSCKERLGFKPHVQDEVEDHA